MQHKTVNLSLLPGNQRREWWSRIQKEAPELAKLLQDPQVVKLRTALSGQIIIKLDENGKIVNGNPRTN